MNKEAKERASEKVNRLARELIMAEAALMEVKLPPKLFGPYPNAYENSLLDHVHNVVHIIERNKGGI